MLILHSVRGAAQACNPSSWQAEAGWSGVQDHLSYIESEASLGYLKPCLKDKQKMLTAHDATLFPQRHCHSDASHNDVYMYITCIHMHSQKTTVLFVLLDSHIVPVFVSGSPFQRAPVSF